MEFGLLGVLLARALCHSYSLTRIGLFIWTTAICASFGLLDEAHQFLVPERIFDLMDLVFDSTGAATGTGLYIFFEPLKKEISETMTTKNGDIDV